MLHNAAEGPDGTWAWRYDHFRFDLPERQSLEDNLGMGELWEAIDRVKVPSLKEALERILFEKFNEHPQ